MQKLKLAGFVVAALVSTGCGVNPDRLAALQERNASMAEDSAAQGENTEVAYDDSDPKPIRDAVMALKDMKASLAAGNSGAYRERRYELVSIVQIDATPEVREHDKFASVYNAMRALDREFAAPAGETSIALVNSERVINASADALYAIEDAFDACSKALGASDIDSATNHWRTYEASLGRAKSLDASSPGYVGRRANGVGVVDVPFESAYCEVAMAAKRAEAADQPPAAEDKSKTYAGCGAYDLEVEAAEVGSNRFGEFRIKTFSAQDPQPGAAVPVACEKIPPMSDAPNSVVRVVKSGVRWWAEGDIVSMAGPFAYSPGGDGKLVKTGTVRVFRKEATLKTNRCGADDLRVTCEAEGAELARAYNHAGHYLKRADFHRKAGAADRCKEMADRAYKALNTSVADVDAEKIFKTADGAQMTHPEIVSRLEAMKSEANDALASDWCTKP